MVSIVFIPLSSAIIAVIALRMSISYISASIQAAAASIAMRQSRFIIFCKTFTAIPIS